MLPAPEPATANPVANERFFLKKKQTTTVAGRYRKPSPAPTTNKSNEKLNTSLSKIFLK